MQELALCSNLFREGQVDSDAVRHSQHIAVHEAQPKSPVILPSVLHGIHHFATHANTQGVNKHRVQDRQEFALHAQPRHQVTPSSAMLQVHSSRAQAYSQGISKQKMQDCLHLPSLSLNYITQTWLTQGRLLPHKLRLVSVPVVQSFRGVPPLISLSHTVDMPR